jgi:hypothetical protein
MRTTTKLTKTQRLSHREHAESREIWRFFPPSRMSGRQVLPSTAQKTPENQAQNAGTVLAGCNVMSRVIHIIVALPLALALSERPAHADFYALDGRFQCLSQSRAVCYDARPSRAASAPAATEAPETAALAAPAQAETPQPAFIAPSPAPTRSLAQPDPMLEIAARIKAKRPAADDVAALRRAAAAGDPRAIELLAWCALRGIGTGRDPMAAYLLYGEAPANAVPRARENQAAIYTQLLSSEERQRILAYEATPPSARSLSDLASAGDAARIAAGRP